MSCSKEALMDINEAATTDVGYNIVARVAFTKEEFILLVETLEDTADEYSHLKEYADALKALAKKVERQLK